MKKNVCLWFFIGIAPLYCMDEPVTPKQLLIRAATKAHYSALKELLDKGEKITTTDDQGNSLLVLALAQPPYNEKRLRTIETLLNYPDGQALITKKAEDKSTPLQLLINGLNTEESKNLPEDERKTSIGFGTQILNLLFARGIDPYEKGFQEENAFHLAHKLGIIELAQYMQSKRDKYMRTLEKVNPVCTTLNRERRPSLDRLSSDLHQYFARQPKEELSVDEETDQMVDVWLNFFEQQSSHKKNSEQPAPTTIEVVSHLPEKKDKVQNCCDII